MGLFDLFKSKPLVTTDNTFEQDDIFEHILKVFFDFQDKYPDRIVSMGIYPSKKITECVAFDITFILDGKVDYLPSIETSEMLEFFELVDYDGTFQTFECTRSTAEEANNYMYVEKKLKSYVKHFMQENPSRKFDLSKAGATIKFW